MEQAGIASTTSIARTTDIDMEKKALHQDIGRDIKGVMQYVSDDDVRVAKELIMEAISDDCIW